MPDWLHRFRQVVWTAVGAAGAALLLLAGGLVGWSVESIIAVGFIGMIFATLSLRN